MKLSKLMRFLLMSAWPMGVEAEGGGGSFDVNENGEALGTGNDARIAMLNKLADQADQLRGDEFVDIVNADTGETAPFVVQTAEGETTELTEKSEQEAALAAEQAEAAAANQTPTLPTLVVNGKTVQITPEIIAKAQKIEAADVYLKEAASIRNNLVAKQQAAPQQQAASEQAEDLVALTRAIQMGSEEEAVAAIRKLQQAGPSLDDIARTIDDRVLFNTSIAEYRKNFSDITADPILNKLAIDKDAELVRARDGRSYYERWSAIGTELRAWKDSMKGPAQAAPVVQQDTSKQARKAAAITAPNTSGAVKQSSVQEEREESPGDIIRAMAASRGGAQAMFGAPKI